eukprot:jgi/Bigna1/91253/estExt_fgenesh1_pg.C_940035
MRELPDKKLSQRRGQQEALVRDINLPQSTPCHQQRSPPCFDRLETSRAEASIICKMEYCPGAVVIQRVTEEEGIQRVLRTDDGMYLLGPQLGEGGISRVVSARHLSTGDAVAVKIVERGFQGGTDMSNESRAMQEIKCLSCLSHPNVVAYKSHYVTEDSIYIVQELVNGISLLDYLKHKGNRIKTGAALHIFYQAVRAIEYCHANFVYHRDIKLENMIVDINGNVQLIDFDLAHRSHNKEGATKLDLFCGTPHIACPEIWRADPYDAEKADIWSLGVILYVLLTGAYPYDGDDLEDLRDEILHADLIIPLDLPGPMKDLLSKMLNKDPSKRVATSDLVQHPVVEAAGVTNACVRSKLQGNQYRASSSLSSSSSSKRAAASSSIPKGVATKPFSSKPESSSSSSSSSASSSSSSSSSSYKHDHAREDDVAAHRWEAPVVDDTKIASIKKKLGKEELLSLHGIQHSRERSSKRQRCGGLTSQPGSPMWEVRGASPLDTEGSPCNNVSATTKNTPPSPNRKSILTALDNLLDEPTNGLSAEHRSALLAASEKDGKMLSLSSSSSNYNHSADESPSSSNNADAGKELGGGGGHGGDLNLSDGGSSKSTSPFSSSSSSSDSSPITLRQEERNRGDGEEEEERSKPSGKSRKRKTTEYEQVMAAEVVHHVLYGSS